MTDPKEVADLVARLKAGKASIPGMEVVWVQNMRAFIQTEMFRTFPEWRKIFEEEFNSLLAAAEEASTTLETLSSELERVKGERDAFERAWMEASNSMDQWRARALNAEASLGVAVKALRPAGKIAYNMKQTAIYTSDRENYRRISEAIDAAVASIQAKGE